MKGLIIKEETECFRGATVTQSSCQNIVPFSLAELNRACRIYKEVKVHLLLKESMLVSVMLNRVLSRLHTAHSVLLWSFS